MFDEHDANLASYAFLVFDRRPQCPVSQVLKPITHRPENDEKVHPPQFSLAGCRVWSLQPCGRGYASTACPPSGSSMTGRDKEVFWTHRRPQQTPEGCNWFPHLFGCSTWWSIQSMRTSATCKLFLSCMNMWLLPLMPMAGSEMKVKSPPAPLICSISFLQSGGG